MSLEQIVQDEEKWPEEGKDFPGLRSLCPEGKHPAEEAAQGPQLRLSQQKKGGCLTWALRMVPFPHLST